MKAVILAGGFGTRISEETRFIPKPLIEVGGRPILWHIMKIYASHGIKDFIICCGYKASLIKEYFCNYTHHESDLHIDLRAGKIDILKGQPEPWNVTLIDTGLNTQTGGRLRRVKEYIGNDPFCFTYGDGVADIDLSALIAFHKEHGKQATVTAIAQPSRYGVLDIHNGVVEQFLEKPETEESKINGGFFVLNPSVIDLIENDNVIWEHEPLHELAARKELVPFQHHGFWHCMDTLRDKQTLEALWAKREAPWRVW